MEQFSENPDFDAFLNDLEHSKDIGERQEMIMFRFRVFLKERGLQFDEEDSVEGVVQLMRLLSLVTQKSMCDVVIEHDGTDERIKAQGTKKNLQVQLLADGFDRVWLDLVDAEFPGEPLSYDEEAELVTELLVEQERQHTENQLLLFQITEAMKRYYEQLFDEEATEEVELILFLFATRKGMEIAGVSSGLPQDRGSLEEARVVLRKNNLTGPKWIKFIEEFFS